MSTTAQRTLPVYTQRLTDEMKRTLRHNFDPDEPSRWVSTSLVMQSGDEALTALRNDLGGTLPGAIYANTRRGGSVRVEDLKRLESRLEQIIMVFRQLLDTARSAIYELFQDQPWLRSKVDPSEAHINLHRAHSGVYVLSYELARR